MMKVTILLLAFLSIVAARKVYPPEFYVASIKRIHCDFELAKVDHKCDMAFEEVDQTANRLFNKAEYFCTKAFMNLDSICKASQNEHCIKEYNVRSKNCKLRFKELNLFLKMKYELLDEMCDAEYIAYDAKCEPKKAVLKVPVKAVAVKPLPIKVIRVIQKPVAKIPKIVTKVNKTPPKKLSGIMKTLRKMILLQNKKEQERLRKIEAAKQAKIAAEKARLAAIEKARLAKIAAAEKARKAKIAAAIKAKKDAMEKLRRQAEEKARRLAELKEEREAAIKEKLESEVRAQKEAELAAKREAALEAKIVAEIKLQKSRRAKHQEADITEASNKQKASVEASNDAILKALQLQLENVSSV